MATNGVTRPPTEEKIIKNGDDTSANNSKNGDDYDSSLRPFLKTASLMNFAQSAVVKQGQSDRRVLVIYTGGTIGMVPNSEGALAPQKNIFETLIRTYPHLHDNTLWKQKVSTPGFDTSFLVLPASKDTDRCICYKIMEYEQLLDSSNISEKEWVQMANDIMKYYSEFDGFVVLHGTDTLAYTASALSFMFENLGKAVVLTGSQIPIFEPRSDGSDNFVSSLIIAGTLNIPEVTIFFNSKLFRGNRTRKISTDHFFAFDSPNHVPLVEVGIDFEVNTKAIFRPTVIDKCRLHAKLSNNVGLLRIFPSVSGAVFKAFCQPPIEGVVLETYGAGNIPSNRHDVLAEIKAAVKRGVLFVNITQCNMGSVSAIYETGKALEDSGVVAGYDMTPEAALTKLSYVLSKTELDYKQKKEMLSTNIRGELTRLDLRPAAQDDAVIDVLANSLKMEKNNNFKNTVYVALIQYALDQNDNSTIKKMLDMGADINVQNYEGKTVLHEAILRGNHCMVEYLLKNGANIHIKTKCGETPLLTAIQRNDIKIIKLLIQCGGQLASTDMNALAELLSLAARSGCVQKLEALRVAGVDLNHICDEIRQTPLHKAVLCNASEAVEYLLKHGGKPDAVDVLGRTPLDYAIQLNQRAIVNKLQDNNSSTS